MGIKRLPTPKRGDVFLVCFDPTVGSEIQKTRPALIIQNNINNTYSPTVIVAAITSVRSKKIYPTQVSVPAHEGGLEENSVVLLNQVRTMDKQRLIKKLGTIQDGTLYDVDRALEISLGLLEI